METTYTRQDVVELFKQAGVSSGSYTPVNFTNFTELLTRAAGWGIDDYDTYTVIILSGLIVIGVTDVREAEDAARGFVVRTAYLPSHSPDQLVDQRDQHAADAPSTPEMDCHA